MRHFTNATVPAMHVQTFVLTCCILFIIALFQGDLFSVRADARNTDLQLIIVFCLPILVCLMCWVLFVIFTAVRAQVLLLP